MEVEAGNWYVGFGVYSRLIKNSNKTKVFSYSLCKFRTVRDGNDVGFIHSLKTVRVVWRCNCATWERNVVWGRALLSLSLYLPQCTSPHVGHVGSCLASMSGWVNHGIPLPSFIFSVTRPYAIHLEYFGSAAIGLEEGYNHTYNHHELPVVSGGGVCYGRSADSVGMLC